MLSFKFSYPIKPKKGYELRYGLDSKPRPYHFNYPAGLLDGRYRFNYDRRDSIHIENDELQIVKWGSEIDVEKEISFVKWGRNIDIEKIYRLENILDRKIEIEKIYRLENILDRKIEIEEIDNKLEDTFYNLYQECSKVLEKDFIKSLEINKDFILDKIKDKLIDIYKDILVEKNIFKELFTEKLGYLISERFSKALSVENLDRATGLPFKEVCKDSHTNTLDNTIKHLETENERQYFKSFQFDLETDIFDVKFVTNYVEMYFAKIKEDLELNIFKNLDIFKDDYLLDGEFIKNILIEKIEKIISKEENNDLDIFRGENPYFKKFNEIIKEPISKIIFLRSVYEIVKEKGSDKLELAEEIIDIFKDKYLEKNFEVDLEIEDTIKMLSDTTIHELEIEEDFKQLEKVYEIIIHIENQLKELDKEYIVDLFIEDDIHKLIKKLLIHDLITEDESIQLDKSFIGKILLEKVLGLDRVKFAGEIIIDDSITLVKGFQEIMIEEDSKIELVKEVLEIDISKEKEFVRVVKEIEIEANEETIKFNKRFWFLRATNPFDLKILPFSDYPYSEKPLIFGNSLIPDNWQLDMPWVPKLHEKISEHPIPFGKSLGRNEMALSIEIMIDVINIMILIWSRMFYNFSGYTGSQAVIRFTKILYDWLMLETSLEQMEEKGSTEHYFRIYNWIRWEAEKVSIKAKDDMSLSGNMYIDEWIFELIYYMENHHFDTMPLFNVIEKMDEYRALLPADDPQGDINFVLDKVKGMRHKVLDGRIRKNNE